MKVRQFAVALVLCAGVFVRTPVVAQEWTRFRGPNGTGLGNAPELPVAITPADYNWRVSLPGTGISSPVLWGKRIFLTSAEEPTTGAGKRHVICLDSADGRTLWTKTYDYPKYGKTARNSFASSTPAVDADYFYVVWATSDAMTIYALDHSGREIWKHPIDTGVNCGHGAANSPVVVGDIVILANDQESKDAAPGRKVESFLLGLDRKTGAVRWKVARTTSEQANSYSTPMLYQPKNGPSELIVSCTPHGVSSIDPRTGALNWETGHFFNERTVASPILANNGLIIQTAGVSEGGGKKLLAAIRPGSKPGGVAPKVEYTINRDIAQVPTPIVVGDRIYTWGDGGIVMCLHAGTGEPIWKERAGGTFYGSPVAVNGKLYAMNTLGELVVIEASDSFKILGRSHLGEPSHSTPAIANGVMYLRTMSHLIAVGGRKN